MRFEGVSDALMFISFALQEHDATAGDTNVADTTSGWTKTGSKLTLPLCRDIETKHID